LLNVLDAVAKARAGFRSLKDTWADTTTPHGRLMLTVLGGLAEFERAKRPVACCGHRVDSLRCEGSDAIGAKRTCGELFGRVDPTLSTRLGHRSPNLV
jgi:hypothetical protein